MVGIYSYVVVWCEHTPVSHRSQKPVFSVVSLNKDCNSCHLKMGNIGLAGGPKGRNREGTDVPRTRGTWGGAPYCKNGGTGRIGGARARRTGGIVKPCWNSRSGVS